MTQPIGYEIGEFKDGKWIDFADCTPHLMPREEAEDWLHNLNAGPKPAGSEYRLIEVHESKPATEEA